MRKVYKYLHFSTYLDIPKIPYSDMLFLLRDSIKCFNYKGGIFSNIFEIMSVPSSPNLHKSALNSKEVI